jgi:hypothetical protein
MTLQNFAKSEKKSKKILFSLIKSKHNFSDNVWDLGAMDDVHGLPDNSEALLKDCDHSLRRRNFHVSKPSKKNKGFYLPMSESVIPNFILFIMGYKPLLGTRLIQ